MVSKNTDWNILRDVCDTIYPPTATVLSSVPGPKLVPEAFTFKVHWSNMGFYLHVIEEAIVNGRPFVQKRRVAVACLIP